MQIWKVTKAFKVTIKWEKGSRPTIEVKLKSEIVLLVVLQDLKRMLRNELPTCFGAIKLAVYFHW